MMPCDWCGAPDARFAECSFAPCLCPRCKDEHDMTCADMAPLDWDEDDRSGR